MDSSQKERLAGCKEQELKARKGMNREMVSRKGMWNFDNVQKESQLFLIQGFVQLLYEAAAAGPLLIQVSNIVGLDFYPHLPPRVVPLNPTL